MRFTAWEWLIFTKFQDTLETERLLLRPVNEADFDAVHSGVHCVLKKLRFCAVRGRSSSLRSWVPSDRPPALPGCGK